MRSVLLLLLLLHLDYFARAQEVTLLKDIVPGSKGIFDNGGRILGPHNGFAYVQFRRDKDMQYWKTNGTSSGTNFVGSIPNTRVFQKFKKSQNGYIIFIRDYDGQNAFWFLWSETGVLERIATAVPPVSDFVIYQDELLFHPDTGIAKLVAIDLYTKKSRVVHTYGSMGSRLISACDSFVFIVADPNESEQPGTMAFYVYKDKKINLLQVVNTGQDKSEGLNPLPYQNKIYFWYHPTNDPYQLWVTDGTQSGTKVISDSLIYEKTLELFYRHGHSFIGKNIILFTGLSRGDCEKCFDLYSLNPSTNEIFKLNATDRPDDTGDNYIQFGNDIYFSIKGMLARTDGTSIGTEKFMDGDMTGSSPNNMTTFNGRLYYLAFELGIDRKVVGTDLWSYDPSTPSRFEKYEMKGVTPISGIVGLGQHMILIAKDGTHGSELFEFKENISEKK